MDVTFEPLALLGREPCRIARGCDALDQIGHTFLNISTGIDIVRTLDELPDLIQEGIDLLGPGIRF